MTVCGIKHADGVCVMGECPYFKRCCPIVWDKSGKVEQTNEEWFCSLSTEEKAKWMAKHMSFCEVCEIQTCRGDGCQRFDRGSMTETDAFREWLKEIHNDNS